MIARVTIVFADMYHVDVHGHNDFVSFLKIEVKFARLKVGRLMPESQPSAALKAEDFISPSHDPDANVEME